MFNRIAFVIFFICSFHSLVAQKNFEEAFIVLNSGDTLKGFVNNMDWRQNPKTIDFKMNLESPAVAYTATQVKLLFLEKSKIQYIGATIKIDKTPLTAQELSKIEGKLIVEESTFLRVLVKGHMSLFYYYDFKPHYFISKEKKDIQELIVQLSVIKNNQGVESFKTYNKYILQLNYEMGDCPSLQKKITKAPFSDKSLKALVLEYNHCKEATIDFVDNPPKVKPDLGIIVGGSLTTLNFTGDFDQLVKSDFANSYTVNGGLFLNLVFPNTREQWALRNELLYKTYNTHSTYQTEVPGRITTYNNYAEFSHLKYNLGAQWKAPSKKIRPFINLGLALSILLKSDAYCNIESVGSPSYTKQETYATGSYELGYWIGAGVSMNRISLELRTEYSGSGGWEKTLYHTAHVNNIFFLVSYRLNSASE